MSIHHTGFFLKKRHYPYLLHLLCPSPKRCYSLIPNVVFIIPFRVVLWLYPWTAHYFTYSWLLHKWSHAVSSSTICFVPQSILQMLWAAERSHNSLIFRIPLSECVTTHPAVSLRVLLLLLRAVLYGQLYTSPNVSSRGFPKTYLGMETLHQSEYASSFNNTSLFSSGCNN